MSEQSCVAFTGGGSGGHIYPGLAVIERLRLNFDGRIVWLGSEKEADRKVVVAAGVEYFAIPSGKLRRNVSLENLADIFRVFAGYTKSKQILRSILPKLLFSKGGYVSVPPCAAATALGIPVMTHESDLSPGLATRLNSRKADLVLLAYETTRQSLPASLRERAVAVGNPLRSTILKGDGPRGRRFLGLPEDLPLVLVLGGSQGAKQVNDLIDAILPRILERALVVHQTGAANDGASTSNLARGDRYRGLPYIRDELPDLMAAADILVTRAGAGSLWEGAALSKPMILVPLAGAATRGDQVDNARHFEAAGAARVLFGDRATPDNLLAMLNNWLDDPRSATSVGIAAGELAPTDAAEKIANLILERIGAR